MKRLLPSKFTTLILPLLAGGLILGLLVTLALAAWPAILSQPLAITDPFWSITPGSKNICYGFAGFLLASIFTSVVAVATVLLLGWITAIGLHRVGQGTWFREMLVDLLHVLGAIPPIAIGGAIALWVLPQFAQLAGISGRCYLLAIVALVGIHWPRLTRCWVELLESLPPNLANHTREMGASRWQLFRWVLWPATKGRIADLFLETLVRCLGEAAGIIFVCGLGGQSVFQFDLFGNTDTLATKLLSTDSDCYGPHRPSLMMVTLALAVLCLAISVFRWRISPVQPMLPTHALQQQSFQVRSVSSVILVVVHLCYLVPLLLAGNVALESSNAVSGSTMLWATLEWLWLVVVGTCLSWMLAYVSGRIANADRSIRWLQACPPMVWAIGLSCLLPEHLRFIGLITAIVLVQWPWSASAIAMRQRHLPVQPQHLSQRFSAVLMSLSLAVGELNILACYANHIKRPTILGDFALSRSISQERVAIVILLGLSLAFAIASRLIHRIFPPASEPA